MNETVNQEMNGTVPAQQENRTFNQDEVNAIVADRLTRERAKYADYDDLKGKAGRVDEADSRAAALQQRRRGGKGRRRSPAASWPVR